MSRVVLITGVSGGIGKATVKIFYENGWLVIGVDKKRIGTNSQGVHRFFEGDVSEESFWSDTALEVKEHYGHLDALINNAAIQICKPIIETTPEEWDRVMAVNLRSVYLAVRLMFPYMKERDASIVNISSVHAQATSAKIAAYAASKGGLLSLTRAMAVELAAHRIRVNAVLPGAVDTPMLHSGLSRGHISGSNLEEGLEKLVRNTVLDRIGKPDEIAEAIMYLADFKKSSFMTGQTLVIDGGALAKLSTE